MSSLRDRSENDDKINLRLENDLTMNPSWNYENWQRFVNLAVHRGEDQALEYQAAPRPEVNFTKRWHSKNGYGRNPRNA